MVSEPDPQHDDEPAQGGQRHFFGAIPVFLVDDIVTTMEYYGRVLGFEVNFIYGEPPVYGSVSRNDAIINFCRSDPPGRHNGVATAGAGNGVDAYIVVEDVDDLCAELKYLGAKVVVEPESHDYGMRELQIEDCNGYQLVLAQEIQGETSQQPDTGASPQTPG